MMEYICFEVATISLVLLNIASSKQLINLLVSLLPLQATANESEKIPNWHIVYCLPSTIAARNAWTFPESNTALQTQLLLHIHTNKQTNSNEVLYHAAHSTLFIHAANEEVGSIQHMYRVFKQRVKSLSQAKQGNVARSWHTKLWA